MKRVYWSNKKSKVVQASEPEIRTKLISDGDKISSELDSALVQLRIKISTLVLHFESMLIICLHLQS